MTKALIIDDDRASRKILERGLESAGIMVCEAGSAEEALGQIEKENPDVVLLDNGLPDMSGLELYAKLRALAPKTPIIFVTADGASETAIEATKLGAFDYLAKPLDMEKVKEVVEQAVEIHRLMRVKVALPVSGAPADADGADDHLVGRSPQMQGVYKGIGRVAPQDITVLISGESGVGKELVARAIYHHSRRAQGPFLAVNCAALTESLLESELFGHEKGSFTGATAARIGKFEQCSGGTLFLDEVGDMSPLVQSKVLRVLQEQAFERVGGNATIRADVRVIAATNRELEKMVAKGEFREDLYYRLNVFTIRIPPLRERPDDILTLLDWYLGRFRNELKKDVHGISPDALELLLKYPWPGNVRQLQNVLRQALVQSSGAVLIREFLPSELSPQDEASGEMNGEALSSDLKTFVQNRMVAGSTNLHAETLTMMERFLLTTVLRATSGNQSKAAQLLGITRGSLRNKVRQLGIAIGREIRLHEDDEETADEAIEVA